MTKLTSTVTEPACSVQPNNDQHYTRHPNDLYTTFLREGLYRDVHCMHQPSPSPVQESRSSHPHAQHSHESASGRTTQIIIPPRGLTAPREQRAYSHEGSADNRPSHPYELRNSDRLRWVSTPIHHYCRGDAMMAIEKTMLRRAIAKGIRTNCDMQA